MGKTFGYVRTSPEKQNEDNYETKGQEIAIKEYCRQNQIELTEIFCDWEESGFTVDRAGMRNLLDNLETMNKVIVVNTSRLWSNDIVKILVERQFVKLGIDLVSLEEPLYSIYDENQKDLKAKEYMELLDQYDKLNLTMKLGKGRKTKAKMGIKGCGEAPLGYRWKHERLSKPLVVVEPEKAELVKLIFSKYLELGSLGKVKEYLDRIDYQTNRGKSFCTMGIRHILTNEFYIGELTWGDMILTGQHQPIIDKDIFYQVQDRLNRNRRNCN